MAVSFGTSGLRGPAEGFTPEICRAYVAAFLDHSCADASERAVLLGADFRASSPSIVAACASAVVAAGWTPINAGNVPTPALAAYALARRLPAIMVTGSHIPEIYNGIKFYRPDGEFLKEDEAPVRERALALLARGDVAPAVVLPAIDATIAESYVERYVAAFPGAPLAGLKVGVDLHSAVGRDLTVSILERLGAEVHSFRRADHFIAVDTEALDPADVERDRLEIEAHGLMAVVSTDGDGDRPLVIDETGRQINGDILGALTARHLGIATVVTPLSSTSAIEIGGWFDQVVRTRIGSPYVVSAMAATDPDEGPIAGFEANGGFLTESDLRLGGAVLPRLPTRDAILPIIAVLKLAVEEKQPLSKLADELPSRVMKADRLKDVDPATGASFLKGIASSPDARAAIDPRLTSPADINVIDGVRLTLVTGSVVHFRQSGNAPEMRCYVETDDAARTEKFLGELMARLTLSLKPKG
jgi:phosphomannomutase